MFLSWLSWAMHKSHLLWLGHCVCCCCCEVTSLMSNSVRPHRRQPTRLPHPWDSPGKNTGVGCHLFLQCMKVRSESEVTQSCPTLSDPMDCSLPGSSIHGIFQARVLEWGAIAFSRALCLAVSKLPGGHVWFIFLQKWAIYLSKLPCMHSQLKRHISSQYRC